MADSAKKTKANAEEVPVKLLINKGGWTMKLSQISLASLSQAGVKKICAPKMLKCPPGTQPSRPVQAVKVVEAIADVDGIIVPLLEPPPQILNREPSPIREEEHHHVYDHEEMVPMESKVLLQTVHETNQRKQTVTITCTTKAPPSNTRVTPVGPQPKGPIKRYICPKCKEEFPNRKLLAVHKKTHPRLFSCEHCKAEFKSNKAVELHMRAHTGERPYHCELCNKWFRRRDYLKAHQEIHTGSRPHHCEQCNVSFRLRSSLIRHARLHSGERPYKCEFCPEAFTNKHVLKIHTSTHTGHRPYICGHCGMSFIVSTNLRRHAMIHTGEKPYRCDECGERFIQQHHLTQHRLKHSGDTPFQCSECNAAFKFHSSLNNHIKSVHKGIPLAKRRRSSKQIRTPNSNVVVVQSDVQLTNEQQAATLDLLNNICMTMERGGTSGTSKDGVNEWKLAEATSASHKDIETAVAIAQAVSSISTQVVTTSHEHVMAPQQHTAHVSNQMHQHQQATVVQVVHQQQQHHQGNQQHCIQPPLHQQNGAHTVAIQQQEVPIHHHQQPTQVVQVVQAAGKEQGQQQQQQAAFFRANPNRSENVLILPFHRHFHSVW